MWHVIHGHVQMNQKSFTSRAGLLKLQKFNCSWLAVFIYAVVLRNYMVWTTRMHNSHCWLFMCVKFFNHGKLLQTSTNMFLATRLSNRFVLYRRSIVFLFWAYDIKMRTKSQTRTNLQFETLHIYSVLTSCNVFWFYWWSVRGLNELLSI